MKNKLIQWGHVFAGIMIGMALCTVVALVQVESFFSFDNFNILYSQASGVNFTRGCIDGLRKAQGRKFSHKDASRCRERGRLVQLYIYNYLSNDEASMDDIEIDPSPQPEKTKPLPVPIKTDRYRRNRPKDIKYCCSVA
jgi:hypothetical protein